MAQEPHAEGDEADRDVESSSVVPSRLRDLGAYIRDQRNRAELSLRNLAKLAGVSNPYLSQIERGLRKPSAEILQAIAKALRISAETLYVKAGILEEREEDRDLEAAILRESHLTQPQRQALIEMYRSFRQLAELQAEHGVDVGDRERAALRELVELVSPAGEPGDGDESASPADG